jgi:dienelactone hydrolase
MNALFCVLLTAVTAGAEPEPPPPGDAMIENYLKRRAQDLSAKYLDGASTLKEWEAKRQRLRQEYLDMLGLWPLPERTPLHATITGNVEREDVVIEKLHFQSRPGLYVTGNLYRPKKITGRLPTILYVCGHSSKGRDGNKTAFQEHGLMFAAHGYVCLIIDSLQLGEIPGIHHGTYREGRWWWQAAGYTPAGVECWNGVRALDYLVSRPDVDPERLGVTGISGGGAATFWIAAADERVRCAVPVSGMSDLESYVGNKVINGHCDCMFLINTYGWEWTTIAALIPPRPMLFANSDSDTIFPMDGNRRIIARLRQLYKMYDKPDLVDEYVSKGGHADRPDLRLAAFKWMNKHLKGETGEVKEEVYKSLEGKELRVFPEDKDVPKDALNGKIDETFVKRAEVKLPEPKDFAEWKKGMIRQLRQQSFRAFPERAELPVSIGPVIGNGTAPGGHRYEADKGVTIFLSNPLGSSREDAGQGILIVANADDENQRNVPDWVKPFVGKDDLVQMVFPRGTGSSRWTRKSPPNYVERTPCWATPSMSAACWTSPRWPASWPRRRRRRAPGK